MYTLKYTKDSEHQKACLIIDSSLNAVIQTLEFRIKQNPHNASRATEKNCLKTSIDPNIPSNRFPYKTLSIEYTIDKDKSICNVLSIEYKVVK